MLIAFRFFEASGETTKKIVLLRAPLVAIGIQKVFNLLHTEATSPTLVLANVQLMKMYVIPLVNKTYVNEVTLRRQNPPLKCC